ncbi:thiamine diphosphokinase [Gardnerella sp. 2492-Sm]|uniref:thiamine diphosphokinase n=1 Tax=unclassified Gardnerella TaxID=2628112 RepID=UPI003D03917A
MEPLHRCVILAAGDYYDHTREQVPNRALTIAADGGWDYACKLGLHVDALIGDFDSVRLKLPTDAVITRLPEEKDDPDLLSALKYGWSKGMREFHIFGGLGGRVDHTISNIQLMVRLALRGGIGFLYGNGQIVTAIHNAALDFPASSVKEPKLLSVFSHAPVSKDVNESGLKYQLQHAQMHGDAVQGLSNELLDNTPAHIDVQEGTLVITFPTDVPLPQVSWPKQRPSGDLGAINTSISEALAVPLESEDNPNDSTTAAAESMTNK